MCKRSLLKGEVLKEYGEEVPNHGEVLNSRKKAGENII